MVILKQESDSIQVLTETMNITYLPFDIQDYDEAAQFWRVTPFIGLSSADTREAIDKFLRRNPGCSFVARVEQRLVGTILMGHDGRRGYMYHLAVAESYRGMGIAAELVSRGLIALRAEGIEKCHLFVYSDNLNAQSFYAHEGWQIRNDLEIMSINL